MLHELVFNEEFFARLVAMDAQMAAQLAAERCPACSGPLHQGNYLRKPRGGLLALAGEQYSLRFSLCCGWRDCRRRVLPPSLRFLGRRVYLEVVVLFASVVVQSVVALRKASVATGVPTRTLRRWSGWWIESFPQSRTWIELKARFVPPPPNEGSLPLSLMNRLECDLTMTRTAQVIAVPMLAEQMARLLAPATTSSACDASRLLRSHVGGCNSS
jgi:hypothetical protein